MQLGHVPLVGRATDLQQLRDDLAAVGESGRAVVVSGDAGMGKTRLLREFLAPLEGHVVLRGQCVDSGSGPAPLTAIGDLVRAAVDELGAEAVRDAAGPSAEALGVLVPGLAQTGEGPGRLADAVVETLSALARRSRLIIVIEDLHWADGTTLDVVTRLVRRTSALPLFVLMTYRTDDVGRGHPLRPVLAELERARLVRSLRLTTLADSEAAALAAAIAGDSLTPTMLRDIARRSEGIPFYVEELASLSGERLPVSLRDVLLLRYEALDQAARSFVRALATGGVSVPHTTLRAVVGGGDDDFEAAVRSAVDGQVILVHADDYTFRHALMQEAAYAELLPTERVRLHTAYATVLSGIPSSPRVLTDIAHHWWAARVPDRALAAAVAAQGAALEASAWSTAAEAGERALELWAAVPDAEAVAGMPRVQVLRRTSGALVAANRHERALAFAREAVEEWPGDDPAGLASMLGELATVELQSGTADGLESIERALAILGEDSDHDLLRADLLVNSARVHMLSRREPMGWDLAMAARAKAEPFAAAGNRGAAELVAQALLIAATCRTTGGDSAGLVLFEQARAYAQPFTRAMMRYYINYSNALMLVGRYDEAVDLAREGTEYGRDHFADEGPLVMIEANLIEALMYAGHMREAESMGEGLQPLIEPGLFSAFLRERRLCLAVWRGRIDEAEAEMEEVHRELDPFGEYEYQTRSGLAYDLGEIALARGDARAALAHASTVLDYPADGHAPLDLPLAAVAARAIVLLRRAGEDRDVEPFREVIAHLREWPLAPLWSAVFAAELGEGPWSEAFEATGPAYVKAYAMLRDGERLVGEVDRSGAKAMLSQALVYADEIGADLLAARARSLLIDAGLMDESPAVKRRDAALTDREEQVLALVADGLSNGEIAARLYISAKTVSVHVSAILRKLGAASRAEAAASYVRRTA